MKKRQHEIDIGKITRLSLMVKLYVAMQDIEQKSLATEWGCSESTVTRFLTGQALPEPKTLLRIFQWTLEN